MDMTECGWCSQEIEDASIPHKGMVFCCEECVKDWEEDNLPAEDIDLSDLDGLDDGLERDDPEKDDELNFQDDDLLITEEDF